MLILFSTNKSVQLVLYILMNIAFTVYMAAVRPFEYKVQNIMSVFNEAVLIVCCFLMFAFFKEGSSVDGAGVAMIVLFTINIIVCFTISVIFAIYLCLKKRQDSQVVKIITKNGQEKRYVTQLQKKEEESFSKSSMKKSAPINGQAKNEDSKNQEEEMQGGLSNIFPDKEMDQLNEVEHKI
mmetsp:Transcript_42174/g.48968  ORF Transcript_42174/g.48968 Transcript_42174/m.48968 type:complete len:181 (-) Transcript_42174:42-584(-)